MGSLEELSRFIFDYTVQGFFQSTPRGQLLRANPALAQMFGYESPERMIETADNVFQRLFVSAKERTRFKKLLAEGGIVENFEGQGRRADGSPIWTVLNARAVCDEAGKIVSYLGSVWDNTEFRKVAQELRNRAAEALRESEARYRLLVEHIPAIIFLDPADGSDNTSYINSQVKPVLGYTPEEWIADPKLWEKSIHPEDRERVLAEDRRTERTGERFSLEYRLIARDGRTVWIQEESSLIRDEKGAPLFWQGVLLDITDRKESQEALIKSAMSYRGLFDSVSDAVYVQDRDGRFLDVNEGAVAMYGYPHQFFLGKTPDFLAAPGKNDMTKVAKAVKLAFGGVPQQFEFWGMRANGDIFLKEVRLTKGTFFGQEVVFALAQDITEKKRSEEALAKSEEQFRTLVEQASDGIFISDRKGNYIDVNPSGCAMLGYTREEVLKLNLLDIVDRNELARKPHVFKRIRRGQSITAEIRLARKDGTSFPSEVGIKRLPDGRYQGIVRDITERRKAQDSRERQLKELSVLNALAVAGTRARNEDELIEQVTEIIGQTLYPDTIGVLLVTELGDGYVPHPSYRGVTLPNLMRTFKIGEGVAGEVMATGKALNVADVREIENFIQINPQSRSELCVPMTIEDRIIGVINAESSKVGYFTIDDERLLLTIAGQVSANIERLRKEQAEREQRALAEALRDIAAALNSTLEFNEVMDRILDNIDRVVPSKSANIMLLENDALRIIRHRGYTDRHGIEWWDNFRTNIKEIPNLERGARTRKPQLIPDTRKDPNWVTFPAASWIRSHLTAPIVESGSVIGFINLDHDTPDFFTQQDLDRMTSFTSLAATAIENARLFQAEKRRANIIEALAEIANVIATTRDIDMAFDKITDRTLALLNASHVAILLLQDDNQTLKIATAKGLYREQLLSHTIKIGEGITGHVVASGKPEIINDLTDDPRQVNVPHTPKEDRLYQTMMSAPLILRGVSIGAINVWRLRSNGLFEESELNFLTSLAHQASIAIETGRLFEETIRRAQETAAIAEVGRDISSTLQLDVVLERIARYARELLRSETSAVYLADLNIPELRAIAAIGTDAEEIRNDPIQLGTGILGNIALQKIGEIVNDTFTDARAITVKGTDRDPFEHLMGVPVLLQDKLTGLLAVWRSGNGQEYKPTELEFLAGLAQQAAIAIENARLYTSEQQRRREAETLREATAVVAATLDQSRAVELILDQLASVLKYDSAAVQLFRDGFLEIVGGRGWPRESAVLGLRFPIPGDNPNTTVILERKPVILNYTREAYPPFLESPHNHIRSWLGIPLIAHGQVIGMLSVDSTEENHFTEEHARLSTAFANHAAIAIENARLHEQSETQIQRLTALRDVDTAIASSLDLRVTLNILMDHAISQLKTDAMDILVYNPGMQDLETMASAGFQSSRVSRGLLRIGEGLGGKIALSRKPLQILDLRHTPEYERLSWLSEERFVSYFGFPLIGKGQVKGVLETFFRESFAPSADWLAFTQTIAGQAAIAIDNSQLFENLQRINQELTLAYDTTLEGWGKALELRDKETQGHTRRVTELTLRLARRMGLSDAEIANIHRGVLLHDIGKMGVPDHILRKTGPLNDLEWEQMRQHPQHAYDLLLPIAYLRPALDIPYCHHERWDGSGYPRGLKGEEIPIPARIFAVVDVWDALLSERPYRKPWTQKTTMDYIRKEAGLRFDPRVVDIFLQMMSEADQDDRP